MQKHIFHVLYKLMEDVLTKHVTQLEMFKQLNITADGSKSAAKLKISVINDRDDSKLMTLLRMFFPTL